MLEEQQEAGPNIYEDPRGGIFLEFQQGFDRGDHPFMQVDSFCLPHDTVANRVDTDDGITADSIKVGHLAVEEGVGIRGPPLGNYQPAAPATPGDNTAEWR